MSAIFERVQFIPECTESHLIYVLLHGYLFSLLYEKIFNKKSLKIKTRAIRKHIKHTVSIVKRDTHVIINYIMSKCYFNTCCMKLNRLLPKNS